MHPLSPSPAILPYGGIASSVWKEIITKYVDDTCLHSICRTSRLFFDLARPRLEEKHFLWLSSKVVRGTYDTFLPKSILVLVRDKAHIQKIEKIEQGYGNNVWRLDDCVDTKTISYIFKSPKTAPALLLFQRTMEVSQQAAVLGLTPTIIGKNDTTGESLQEYIETTPWPTYEEDPHPYCETMRVLRQFHQQVHLDKTEFTCFTPFHSIFKAGESLKTAEDIPHHFSTAVERMKILFERSLPWLQEHATVCHGDFHKGNVILARESARRPYIIDFDTIALGDPFFDIVKFSVALPRAHRLELFHAYLGRNPSEQEQSRFEVMDLALLMVIATVRYTSAKRGLDDSKERLSTNEMEEMLNSKEPLPSCLSVPFSNNSPKARQLGATYALHEFLRRTETSS